MTTHRRIKERRIAEGETARAAAIVAGEKRHGLIDGVEVDLRHPDIDPAEWEPVPQWYVWGDGPGHAGILFPAEAAHASERELRKMKGGMDFPLIEARPGDLVSVASVIPQIGDGRFDHPHDAQQRLVFLRIERPSGEVVTPEKPMALYGATIIRDGPTREAFDHILSRICLLAGKPSLYDREVNGDCPGHWDWDMPLAEVARHIAAEGHDAYFRLLSLLPDGTPRAYLRQLANDAALAGFLLGKAEAKKAEDIANPVLVNRDKGTAAVTRFDWRDRAREIWGEHPEWTKNRVANAIAEGTLDDPRSIMRAIKGEVPPTSPSYGG